ncbi:MAG: sulfur carrier protein ThiS adenylyltransferase ThiF [Bacteroidetes bacterium]|nr:sulfur carrier protein ThiS adenylyltransferase ThiF [Bacteroidota bacterium]
MDVLLNKTVGIAGCGGLGSNCAVALARVGIGRLILADFDIIVESNLNRQYFFRDQVGQKKVMALRDNLLRINPSVIVEIHDIKLTPDDILRIFSPCEVIVEAFDQADAKEMIIETVLTGFPDKFLVSGVGLAGWGNNNSIQTKQFGKLYICGDGMNEVSETAPPLAPRVGIVSNMQANVVMEILLGSCPGTQDGQKI